ncbi:hypothetical protein Csa_002149 [Cucumis sativus]|uniref:Uncharacterized protein n=1 Tax=Cucumis sativus TaxID=3659 RepID=A0A0A0LG15_CUCSA|nr:hypothetical protein Csa_002149 [Cucumis sativus]
MEADPILPPLCEITHLGSTLALRLASMDEAEACGKGLELSRTFLLSFVDPHFGIK